MLISVLQFGDPLNSIAIAVRLSRTSPINIWLPSWDVHEQKTKEKEGEQSSWPGHNEHHSYAENCAYQRDPHVVEAKAGAKT